MAVGRFEFRSSATNGDNLRICVIGWKTTSPQAPDCSIMTTFSFERNTFWRYFTYCRICNGLWTQAHAHLLATPRNKQMLVKSVFAIGRVATMTMDAIARLSSTYSAHKRETSFIRRRKKLGFCSVFFLYSKTQRFTWLKEALWTSVCCQLWTLVDWCEW